MTFNWSPLCGCGSPKHKFSQKELPRSGLTIHGIEKDGEKVPFVFSFV
jgi:hypothetical protein